MLLAEQNFNQRVAVNLHTNGGLWAGIAIPESGLIVTGVLIGLWLYIS